MRTLTVTHRVLILVALFGAMLAGLSLVGPIPQDPRYHAFADTHTLLGIPYLGDVASNAGFLIVGVLGLATVLRRRGREIFANRVDALPYMVFFAGVALVSIGSGYYHLAPDNERLFWDRVPITIGFMALFSAVLADRLGKAADIRWLLPLFIGLGLTALIYWIWTESLDRGDLRFYALVQLYPIVALPLICWLFPKGHYTTTRHLLWVIAWYGIAKVLEHFDAETLALLGGTVSGHSLKHIAAAVATFVVLRMIVGTRQRTA